MRSDADGAPSRSGVRSVRRGIRPAVQRPRRDYLVIVVLVAWLAAATSACGAGMANTGSGSPEEDLRRLVEIAEQSAGAGGTVVVGRPEELIDYCQRPSDGSAGRGARLVYSFSMESTTPTLVGTGIGELWKQNGREWLGAEASVDDSLVAEERGRVHLFGGGWSIRAEVPLNEDRGEYAVIAAGPCY